MEYIKKEELIKGEIYTHKNGNIFRCDQINNKTIYGKYISITHNVFRKPPENPGNFWINKIRLATPEEKRWLNTCIKLDKFITFEEAMKTFIPEYVEWIDNISSSNLGYQTIYHFKKNKIFKTDVELPSHGFQTQNWITHLKIYPNNYKPSTKEAYNAQFVVKEPEFVLPEKWCVEVDNNNKDFFQKERGGNLNGGFITSKPYPGPHNWKGGLWYPLNYNNEYTKITFEQFKKYVLKEEIVVEKVIEPLPQFKIIETIETITKVENNEGNQFFIGDVVISDSGFVQTIKSFRYNVNKDNVLATTNVCNQISIARLEHYIEPKVEDQFKIGDTIKISTIPVDGSQPKYLNNNYKIIKIRGKQLLFETNSIPPINSVLAKNAIKVN